MPLDVDLVSSGRPWDLTVLTSHDSRLLARHPAVFSRCRQEILDVCPPDNEPTRADIKRLRYLDAVLKEGRLARPRNWWAPLILDSQCFDSTRRSQ